jgi:S-DNA-T family DNA segregation ATPase FtsK/SpoIIIE
VYLVIDNAGVLRSEFPELDLALADLAATSLQFGVHLILTAGRWLDMRPALLDAIGNRIELRLNDPVDSLAGRRVAETLPDDRPGRSLLRDGRHVQIAKALEADALPLMVQDGMQAPRIMPLPARVSTAQVPELAAAAGRTVGDSAGFLLGVSEFRLTPQYVDLAAPGSHLLLFGDDGSGRSTLLDRAVRHLLEDEREVQLHIVDLGRSLLDYADETRVAQYAFTTSLVERLAQSLVSELLGRLPPPDLTRRELLDRSWWSGPEHVVIVDDYDLTLSGVNGPLGLLADALGHAADIGLHVLLARRVAGSSRSSFEAFGQRLRELTPTALVLDGDRTEGPLVGDRTAARQPPGRGFLVRRRMPPTLVQLALPDDADLTRPGARSAVATWQ